MDGWSLFLQFESYKMLQRYFLVNLNSPPSLYMFVTCLCVHAGCYGSESLRLCPSGRGPEASTALGHRQEASRPPQDVAVS